MWWGALFNKVTTLEQEILVSTGGVVHNDYWWHSFWSFMAGAGMVGLVWAFQSLKNLLPGELAADDGSWVDPWNNLRDMSWKAIVENSEYYYYNHIGELPPAPKRRSHWPWETIGRRVFTKKQDSLGEERQTYQPSRTSSFATAESGPESDTDERKKEKDTNGSDQKEFCIGSIFGMDVGGTLAKLVYFEQKQAGYDPLSQTPRERQYTAAASAQAVLKARNSSSTNNLPVTTAKTMNRSSSTWISTGETNGLIDPPSPTHRRRRSLSLDSLGRFKDLQKQLYEGGIADNNECDSDDRGCTTPAKRSSHRAMHSTASQIDLHELSNIRSESIPDDLNHFRDTVHFETTDPSIPSHRTRQAKEAFVTVETTSAQNMKKSRSMFDLNQSKQKAVALDRFYNFARRLDSYENSVRDHQLSFYSRELGGEFHFIHFESRWMRHAMDLIRYHDLHLNISKMGATGGGAHKYAKEWEESLGIEIDKQEELDSLVAGMQFVLSTVVGECYTFRPHQQQKEDLLSSVRAAPPCATSSASSHCTSEVTDHQVGAPMLDESFDEPKSTDPEEPSEGNYKSAKSERKSTKVDEWWWSRKVQRDAISYSKSYPYLLVTIGTGVSILRVDGPRKHERISGSTIGGGTYWGLIRLLTDVEDFEDVMRLAEKGDPAKVDMMVGDIYGENSDALEKLGLPSNVVASSFGKLVSKEDPAAGLEQEDLARALLLMITNNIGQVAYLNAKLHDTRRIYFIGNFLRGNTLSQRRLSYAIDYWSKGDMEALFLEHEGYFGALGAFLMSQKIEQDDKGFVPWGTREGRATMN